MSLVLWESLQLLFGGDAGDTGTYKPCTNSREWTLRMGQDINKITWADHGTHYFTQKN